MDINSQFIQIIRYSSLSMGVDIEKLKIYGNLTSNQNDNVIRLNYISRLLEYYYNNYNTDTQSGDIIETLSVIARSISGKYYQIASSELDIITYINPYTNSATSVCAGEKYYVIGDGCTGVTPPYVTLPYGTVSIELNNPISDAILKDSLFISVDSAVILPNLPVGPDQTLSYSLTETISGNNQQLFIQFYNVGASFDNCPRIIIKYNQYCPVNTRSAASIPTINSTAPTEVTNNSFVAGGTLISNGGSTIERMGIIYSTNSIPVLNNSIAVLVNNPNSPTSINFQLSVTNNIGGNIVLPNTSYYIRAFAVNGVGVGYGSINMVTTLQIKPTINTPIVIRVSTTSATVTFGYINDGGAIINTFNGFIRRVQSDTPISRSVQNGVEVVFNDLSVNTMYEVYSELNYTADGVTETITSPIVQLTTDGTLINITSSEVNYNSDTDSYDFNSTFVNNSNYTIVSKGFYLSTNRNQLMNNANRVVDSLLGSLSIEIMVYRNSLTPNTIYYYSPYVIYTVGSNSIEANYNVKQFRVLQVPPSLGGTSARESGDSYVQFRNTNFSNTGGATISAVGFYYTNSNSPDRYNDNEIEGSIIQRDFFSLINTLLPATTYYIRAFIRYTINGDDSEIYDANPTIYNTLGAPPSFDGPPTLMYNQGNNAFSFTQNYINDNGATIINTGMQYGTNSASLSGMVADSTLSSPISIMGQYNSYVVPRNVNYYRAFITYTLGSGVSVTIYGDIVNLVPPIIVENTRVDSITLSNAIIYTTYTFPISNYYNVVDYGYTLDNVKNSLGVSSERYTFSVNRQLTGFTANTSHTVSFYITYNINGVGEEFTSTGAAVTFMTSENNTSVRLTINEGITANSIPLSLYFTLPAGVLSPSSNILYYGVNTPPTTPITTLPVNNSINYNLQGLTGGIRYYLQYKIVVQGVEYSSAILDATTLAGAPTISSVTFTETPVETRNILNGNIVVTYNNSQGATIVSASYTTTVGSENFSGTLSTTSGASNDINITVTNTDNIPYLFAGIVLNVRLTYSTGGSNNSIMTTSNVQKTYTSNLFFIENSTILSTFQFSGTYYTGENNINIFRTISFYYYKKNNQKLLLPFYYTSNDFEVAVTYKHSYIVVLERLVNGQLSPPVSYETPIYELNATGRYGITKPVVVGADVSNGVYLVTVREGVREINVNSGEGGTRGSATVALGASLELSD